MNKFIFTLLIIVFIKRSRSETTSLLLNSENNDNNNNFTITSNLSPTEPSSSSPSTIILNTTRKPLIPSFRLPCSCNKGQCGCCTGYIMDKLNQKACLNMTYEPEEFAIHALMTLNDVPFYENTISGKNPPPICVRLPRLRFLKLCMEFSNVYFANKNAHLCMDADVNWENFTLLEWSFDCVRMGIAGFQVIRPEDGSGIPEKPIDNEEQINEDYDDSARHYIINGRNRKNPNNNIVNKESKIIFHSSLKKINNPTRRNNSRKNIAVKRNDKGDYLVFVPK